jgi:hypothetical protein
LTWWATVLFGRCIATANSATVAARSSTKSRIVIRSGSAIARGCVFIRAVTAAVNAEVDALAKWLGLDDVRYA